MPVDVPADDQTWLRAPDGLQHRAAPQMAAACAVQVTVGRRVRHEDGFVEAAGEQLRSALLGEVEAPGAEPVGRRLDFLMQELNREANTLASKSNDTETTRASVELKVLIEQMREQIQNVE